MTKVLIIEDEPELLQNIASYLRSFRGEFEVFTASSGEQGMEILESQGSIELLLTDVRLPGIDGIEVVRRSLRAWPELRIVVMTAFASPKTKTQVLSNGALCFIEKPIDMDNLKSLIDEVIQANRGWSGAVRDLDIFDLAQLFLMTRKTRTVRVNGRDTSGTLIFEAGTLTHASTPELEGIQAFGEMIGWDSGTFDEIPNDHMDHPPNVVIPTTQLMLEAARLRDENRDRTALEDRS